LGTQELRSWGFSVAELSQAQRQDEELLFVLGWLEGRMTPETSELFRASPAAKFYWLNKEQFLLLDDVMYQHDRESDDVRLVMPKSLREEAMALCHSLPSSGHQGSQRTREKVKEKFAWYGVGLDVKRYVSQCEVCNQNKKVNRQGKCPLMEYQAGSPMERVHIDFLGPLPKTPRGNEHILMMVDQFTKWVECIPLPSQSAEVTARAAVDGFFSRFGMPFEIFSDQGRNFESKLFTEVCKVLEIHKARTTPYRPSSNGQVERYNRILMDAVRCFIGKTQNQWDLCLQQIAGALRSSVNRMTGFTANRLMLGREVNIPAQMMFPHKMGKVRDPEDYSQELSVSLQEAHKLARDRLKSSSKRMKRNYDLRVLERNYEVGDRVYLLDTAVLKGKCRKLCPPWKGPGVIVTKLSSVLFRVKLRNAVFVVNHDRLKPCHDREVPRWIKIWEQSPRDIACPKGDDKLYCLCQKPWQGRFMIQCDHCGEWFHGSCVNVTAVDALNINLYKCPDCMKRSRRN
jgi:hypothetical protein